MEATHRCDKTFLKVKQPRGIYSLILHVPSWHYERSDGRKSSSLRVLSVESSRAPSPLQSRPSFLFPSLDQSERFSQSTIPLPKANYLFSRRTTLRTPPGDPTWIQRIDPDKTETVGRSFCSLLLEASSLIREFIVLDLLLVGPTVNLMHESTARGWDRRRP